MENNRRQGAQQPANAATAETDSAEAPRIATAEAEAAEAPRIATAETEAAPAVPAETAPALTDNAPVASAETAEQDEATPPAPQGKKAQFLQFLKFVGFSCSAGVIQLLSFELLYNWIGWKQWWAAYLISLTLSVLWNFTFNRKFTFKSAGNVPLAMGLVILYYCAFTPVSVLGGDALEGIGWNGTLVTVLMMLANFLTEFVWDKFVVFNDPLLKKIFRRRGRKQ